DVKKEVVPTRPVLIAPEFSCKIELNLTLSSSLTRLSSLSRSPMTTDMGPPLPRNPNPQPQTLDEPTNSSYTMKPPMGPPPPRNLIPNPKPPNSEPSQQEEASNQPVLQSNEAPPKEDTSGESPEADIPKMEKPQSGSVPYTIPPWSEAPSHAFFLEVLKGGSIIDQLDVYDDKVKKKTYVELHVGDVIQFGLSSRLYIFQGPKELMPPENELKSVKYAKMRAEMEDREASLMRARREASLADGISWGMGEDAIEEAEDDINEVTWQTYKGQLTEKQEKTREKIIKRSEKASSIAHMRKEIDAIRAKDISQGGLTQGQQTQIARNEQRISQLLEELENLEETLNESIQESIGARAGKKSRAKKGGMEEEEEFSSDDDDFYDRTKKKPSIQKVEDKQAIETADTLLEKKDAIMKELEEKSKLLLLEKNNVVPETEVASDADDTLDAYMSGISSQLAFLANPAFLLAVFDKTVQLEMEMSNLHTELDRIIYLLKIADPTGEAVKKRDSKVQETKLNQSMVREPTVRERKPKKSEITISSDNKLPTMDQKETHKSEKSESESTHVEETTDASSGINNLPESGGGSNGKTESKKVVYTVTKPQWLGDIKDKEIKETQEEALSSVHESDEFVDYRDRKVLGNVDVSQPKVDSGIEGAAPGLIIRKQKKVEKLENAEKLEKSTNSSPVVTTAEDAVALLLKHKRGYSGLDDEHDHENYDIPDQRQSRKDNKKLKRVLGPEKPAFLDSNTTYEEWVPPQGQSGDGRTSLNDRYGY
ncbi:hypothetical protein RJ641_006622, partial [Dillenia turbinata]